MAEDRSGLAYELVTKVAALAKGHSVFDISVALSWVLADMALASGIDLKTWLESFNAMVITACDTIKKAQEEVIIN